MTYYQQARRLMRWRTYAIFAFIALGAVLAMVGDDIMRAFVRPCDASPAYRDDVPADVRATVDLLHREGLLYCSAPLEGLATMQESMYWGSDGLSSVLFFQGEDLSDVELARYAFASSPTGEGLAPGEPGAAPPDGFREVRLDGAATANRAMSGAHYFFTVRGAPTAADAVVSVALVGPAKAQKGWGDRDFFRDLEVVWNRLRGQPAGDLGDTMVRTTFAILPTRWETQVRVTANPELVAESGAATSARLIEANPSQPTFYRMVSGALGTTVWVAGVVTGTVPAVAIVAPDGSPAAARASALWTSTKSSLVLLHGAFDPVGPGTSVEVLYWRDEGAAATAAPDYRWPISAP